MSATSLDLLRRFYLAGTDVAEGDDGSIDLSGQRPSEELVAELRVNKADVLDTLRGQRVGRTDDGLASALPRRFVTPSECLAPRVCSRLRPCIRFLNQRPCVSQINANTDRKDT